MKQFLISFVLTIMPMVCVAQYYNPFNSYHQQQEANRQAYESGYEFGKKMVEREEENLKKNPVMMRGRAVEEMASGQYEKAYKRFEYLAENYDDTGSWQIIGYMNELGMGTSKSYVYAKTCFTNGAELGDQACKLELKRINQKKYLGSECKARLRSYFENIVAMGSQAVNSLDLGLSSGSSNSSSSSRSSSGVCTRCGGTGVDPARNSGGSLSSWVAHFNSQGDKCPYCGSYTKHFHDKCSSCNVPRY